MNGAEGRIDIPEEHAILTGEGVVTNSIVGEASGNVGNILKEQSQIPDFFDFANEKLGGKFIFQDVLNFIDTHFNFTPVRFSVGEIDDTKEGTTKSTDQNGNDVFTNNDEVIGVDNKNPEKTAGSCKVLAYARLLGPKTSPLGILHLFGEHYNSLFKEIDGRKVFVTGENHPNIRALIKGGLDRVKFYGDLPLTPKAKK